MSANGDMHLPMTTSRTNISSGAPWEPIAGYSRAVRVGNTVHVSGTTAFGAGGTFVGTGDVTAQARQCLQNIEAALTRCGATRAHVVRTRIYVTDISRWEEVARVHGDFFRDILPTTSMVGVSALIDPRMLVEIEAEAIIPL